MKIDFPIDWPWCLSKQRKPLVQGFVRAIIGTLPDSASRADIESAVSFAMNADRGTFTKNGAQKAPPLVHDSSNAKAVAAFDAKGTLVIDIR